MKVIDLLNKIANGEQPKKIVTNNETLIWNEKRHTYQWVDYSSICWDWYVEENRLNDEVEILEEEKENKPLTKKDIEALGYACGEIQKCFTNGWTKSLENKPLEEKKIPEKLSTWFSVETKQSKELNIEYANTNFENMYEKINEIIDYFKSKGD